MLSCPYSRVFDTPAHGGMGGGRPWIWPQTSEEDRHVQNETTFSSSRNHMFGPKKKILKTLLPSQDCLSISNSFVAGTERSTNDIKHHQITASSKKYLVQLFFDCFDQTVLFCNFINLGFYV